MDALQLLKTRASSPALREPAPSQDQLDEMFKAALRAPDHGGLQPYRFLVVEGEGLDKLGELYLKAGLLSDPESDEAKQKKLRTMAFRAPMIIVAIASIQQHPKVPADEQLITAGCAAHAIVQSAYAQGLGAMWRSGPLAFDPVVKEALGCQENEQIVGFIYLGTSPKVRVAAETDPAPFVGRWG